MEWLIFLIAWILVSGIILHGIHSCTYEENILEEEK